ncbi:hypothetical protein D3869_29335 (plasmid) [Azospirillum brasilense]|uniref:Uncharacterized protein n=1 Tax=Azospirillum brasilense TaxID=192 RepID=A0A4D8RG12_AZOBR|nr:hypothetical protein D3869_29335 [Azospirillum brasilense]
MEVCPRTFAFEMMLTLRKGQASSFNITRDMRGEARFGERTSNLGPGVLTEAVQFISLRWSTAGS